MDITKNECAVCGSTLERVRPGKWQCSKCELDNMLRQAHREGWEQARNQSVIIADSYYDEDCCCGAVIVDAITAMEYKEKAND